MLSLSRPDKTFLGGATGRAESSLRAAGVTVQFITINYKGKMHHKTLIINPTQGM